MGCAVAGGQASPLSPAGPGVFVTSRALSKLERVSPLYTLYEWTSFSDTYSQVQA